MANRLLTPYSTALCHHGNPLGHMGNSMHRIPHVTQRVETVAQCLRIGGQQSLGHGLSNDVIVAIATACATMAIPAGFVGTVSMLSHVTQC